MSDRSEIRDQARRFLDLWERNLVASTDRPLATMPIDQAIDKDRTASGKTDQNSLAAPD